ncbi:phosphoesterase, partial [Escherichia coli]|nr:phosphoesterase [Escherichia coli]
WNAMLRHKRFIIEWIKDVTRRAELEGKKMLTFSHYPMLDILDGTHDDERQVIGNTGSVKRMPLPDVAAAMMDAGVRIHFSGHLHVNDTARVAQDASWLINIGVPSLVAFPPAFKVVTFETQTLNVETVGIDRQSIDPRLNALYRTEIDLTGKKIGTMLDAADYGA